MNKHLYSGRHLHREVNGYWPAYFTQRKLTMYEGSILEKAFWKMFFGSEDFLPVYGFLKTSFMMVTNMRDYVTLDDHDNDADFTCNYRNIMTAQNKQGLNNKIFNHQDQQKRDYGLLK